MRRAFSTLAVLSALMFSAARAEAGFTITLSSTTPSGSNTTFNYTATIAAGDQIQAGDFFRIYDFAGLVAGSTITVPTGWSVTTALLNPTPPPGVILTLGDDPALTNLTFTYNGTTTIAGPTAISGFSAISTLSTSSMKKDFVGRVTSASGAGPVDSRGDLSVPGVAVPEPASIALLGLGGLGLLGLSARSRRNARA